MSVLKPDVILISSDDEDDGETNVDAGLKSVHDGNFNRDAIVISSDDEDDGDGEKNDVEYIELDGDQTDKEEGCLVNCDGDGSDSSNQGGNDLQELSLSGTKEECMQRIEEHERLKDGSEESLYPRSSFSINCTGDACRGDFVLFKQNSYDRQRNIGGKRIVAGRIANESYGASSQHTFSVEVLWSEGFEKLDPLSILLVKGRNLYKYGTFRQPWKSAEERLEVLREKHERGKAARHKRKLMETEFASGGTKGTKRRKVSHRGPSQSKHITQMDKHNDVSKNTTAHKQAVLFQNAELKKSLQLTYHSDPNLSMYSNHNLPEPKASMPFPCDGSLLPNNLLPFGSLGSSHYKNEQGPNQALSQPPDHCQYNNKPPINRLTDEEVKSCFPKSSFSINCAGDARERDIVLFKQHLGGKHVKERTVAGRVVKVRKCGSTDQHKFQIKVLWTTHSKKLRRDSTMVVRSHNLYKFETFRQPWKNEASRSKMFEEKHGPATRKRKLRKKDIASNKNKGMIDIFHTVILQRFQASHKGPSPSKQPTQIAKQKSSKRKSASATPLKENKKGLNRKAKVKKSKQTSKPNLNTNLNPSMSTKPNPISTATSNPNPNQHTPPNPNQDTHPNPNQDTPPNSIQDADQIQNQNLSTRPNSNPNTLQIPNPDKRPNPNPNKRPNPDPNKRQNPDQNKRKKPNMNAHTNPNLNKSPNPNPSNCSNPNPNKHSNPNPNPNKHSNPNPNRRKKSNLNKRPNTNLNLNPNKNAHTNSNLNMNTHTNLNPHPHPHPHPHPNGYIYHDQLHESSSSLPHDGTFIPNHLPIGLLPNQPPVWFSPSQPPNWFSPSQPPFGFSDNGGQWTPNHVFIQPPGYYGYNQMLVQGLMSLLYQNPR